MMNRTLLLFISVLISFHSFGQCPEGSVELNSQAEVNAFVAAYPNCTEINGDLIISNESQTNPIVNLTGLANLTTITNVLIIGDLEYYNPALDSIIPGNLAGLESITSVFSLEVGHPFNGGPDTENTHIESLLPLQYLSGDMEQITIHHTIFYEKLPDFIEVNSLFEFELFECNGVFNTPRFQGLNSLKSFIVQGEVGVIDSLRTIFIPNELETIEGDYNNPYENLRIIRNSTLESVVGGQNLQYIGHALIWVNENLTDLSAFNQVQEVITLQLSSCNVETFNSFKALSLAKGINLYYGDSWTSSFCGDPVDELILRMGEASDGLVITGLSEPLYPGLDLKIYNAGSIVFTGNLKKTANLRIETRNVSTISGFAMLDSIYSPEGNNELRILNPSYSSLPNFANLTHIEGNLYINLDSVPSGLVNLQGLESLETINGDLWVNGNTFGVEQPFQNLNGLDALISIGGGVRLKGLTNLEDISGLQNAIEINQINLERLPVLELDFEFENLLSIERVVMKKTGATNVPFLSNIPSLHVVYLKDNLNLLNTDGFSNVSELNRFSSINNPSLTSITMAEGVVLQEYLNLTMNPSLNNCGESPTICSMVSTASEVEIGENGLNCNTAQEVLNACNGTSVGLDEKSAEIGFEAYFNTEQSLILESDVNGLVEYQLVDAQGKVLVSGSSSVDNGLGSIQVPNLGGGIYTLIIRQDGLVGAQKMVKL